MGRRNEGMVIGVRYPELVFLISQQQLYAEVNTITLCWVMFFHKIGRLCGMVLLEANFFFNFFFHFLRILRMLRVIESL